MLHGGVPLLGILPAQVRHVLQENHSLLSTLLLAAADGGAIDARWVRAVASALTSP